MIISQTPIPAITTYATGRGETLQTITSHTAVYSPDVFEMEQVHGGEIALIHKDGQQFLSSAGRIPGVDGIISSEPNNLLVVRTADCVPILFAHPSGVIGALHAGRQGTRQQIFRKALQLIKQNWHITQDLQVWIGPHICKKCYEINRTTGETYDLLHENLRQLHEEFSTQSVTVTIDDRCTAHNLGELYSYRKEGAGVAMNYSAILRAQPL